MSIAEKKKQIESKFGKGKAQWIGDNKKVVYDFDTVSSGSLLLDAKLGQAFPKRTMVEIIGEEQAGKTTLCLNTIAEAQKKYPDQYCAFVDVEHALDAKYAQDIGVDVSQLLISQPDSAEEALMITDDLIRASACSVVIVDSVAGLVPEEELDKELDEGSVSKLPILMGRATRKFKQLARQSETLLIFTNQWRIAQFQPYVMKDTPGGKALRYFASIRIELKRNSKLLQAEGINIGQVCKAHIKKNKFAAPFREVEFYIMFGQGISKEDELIDIGIEMGEIERGGSWFTFNDETKVQGRYQALSYLQENTEASAKLEEAAREYLFGKQ
jgi:recombination protein RecA